MRLPKILPGTGRGTMRSMVEGALHARFAGRVPPSVSAARCHLPVNGEDLA